MSVLDVINQRMRSKVRKLIKMKRSYLIVVPKTIVHDNFVEKGYRMTVIALSPYEIILKLRVANGANGEYNKDNKERGEDT